MATLDPSVSSSPSRTATLQPPENSVRLQMSETEPEPASGPSGETESESSSQQESSSSSSETAAVSSALSDEQRAFLEECEAEFADR